MVERGREASLSDSILRLRSVGRIADARRRNSRRLILPPLLALPASGCLLTSPEFQTGKRELTEQLRDTHESLTLQNVAQSEDNIEALRAAVDEGRRKAEGGSKRGGSGRRRSPTARRSPTSCPRSRTTRWRAVERRRVAIRSPAR